MSIFVWFLIILDANYLIKIRFISKYHSLTCLKYYVLFAYKYEVEEFYISVLMIITDTYKIEVLQ